MALDRGAEAFLKRYVETPSVTGREDDGVTTLLEETFRARGWETQVLESSRYPGLKNFVARTGPSGPGGLVINSHTDTVAPSPEDWRSGEPVTLGLRDGLYFGNGVVDTKGPTTAAVMAATARIDPSKLRRGLAFWLNHSEENVIDGVSLKGSREMLAWARKGTVRPDAMVVVEPTGLTPVDAHAGYAKVSMAARGRAAHSSVPESGDNAVERMGEAICSLRALRLRLREEHDLPLNIGYVQGGREDQVNVVAESCRLLLDYRCPPDALISEEVFAEIRKAVEGAVTELRPETDPIPPFSCPPDRPIVRLAAEATGRAPGRVGFYSDGSAYQALADDGALRDGMLVLGCGDVRHAHAPDERVGADEIAEGIDVFERLISAYCYE